MDTFIQVLNGANFISILVRLLLAALCGGVLGFGREKRGQAAGFRTYMIVGVGSALVMLTNIYLGQNYGTTDLARMPAAVITGLGFLGAGAIIVTHSQIVRGLTTAAGLWTTAAMGIAFGAGFYVGGLVCFILTVTIMHFMERISHRIGQSTKYAAFYIEMENRSAIGKIFEYTSQNNIRVTDFDVSGLGDPDFPSKAAGKFSLDVSALHDVSVVHPALSSISGIISVYKI